MCRMLVSEEDEGVGWLVLLTDGAFLLVVAARRKACMVPLCQMAVRRKVKSRKGPHWEFAA